MPAARLLEPPPGPQMPLVRPADVEASLQVAPVWSQTSDSTEYAAIAHDPRLAGTDADASSMFATTATAAQRKDDGEEDVDGEAHEPNVVRRGDAPWRQGRSARARGERAVRIERSEGAQVVRRPRQLKRRS